MASARVLNLTTKCYLKVRQAEGRIEHCVSEWVVQGKSIRDLNLAQIVQKRSFVARFAEPIPFAEIPGLRYEPSTRNLANNSESKRLAVASSFLFGAKLHMSNNPEALQLIDQAANRFCLEHA